MVPHNAIKALVNGIEATSVSILDRGLQYGDGLFETIAFRNGEPCLWSRHMQRLASGCERLAIPFTSTDLLYDEIKTLCSGKEQATIKVIITRGVSGRGYRFEQDKQSPTRIVCLFEPPEFPPGYLNNGIAVRVCTTRLAKNPMLAGIKHLNRLEQVMARAEWDNPDIIEGLLLDTDDHVIEATMSNLFIVNNHQLITPDLAESGVAGVMRGLILDICAKTGIALKIESVGLDDVYRAEEVFLCNSIIGIWPVRAVDSQQYPIGTTTQQLIAAIT